MSDFSLSDSIDEGARVADTVIAPRLYLSFKREVHWIPNLYRNAYLALESVDDRAYFIKKLGQNIREERAGRLHVLDAVGDVDEDLLDSRSGHLHSMTLGEASSAIIDSAKIVDNIREKCRETRMLRPAARYFDVLVLRVDGDQFARMCSVEVIRGALQTLVEQGMDSRIPLVVLTDSTSRRHVPILKSCNWSAFMGDENVDFAKTTYSQLDPGIFNPGRIKLGVLAAFDRKYLSVLQPLKYVASEWGAMKKTRQKAEQKVYEDFLKEIATHDTH